MIIVGVNVDSGPSEVADDDGNTSVIVVSPVGALDDGKTSVRLVSMV